MASPIAADPVTPVAPLRQPQETLRAWALHLNGLGVREWGIHYSSYTGKWYVHAGGLYLFDGIMLRGVTVHRDTPEQALVAFMEEIRDEGQSSQVVAVESRGDRRNYRWNGVTFEEVPDFLLPGADNLRGVAP